MTAAAGVDGFAIDAGAGLEGDDPFGADVGAVEVVAVRDAATAAGAALTAAVVVVVVVVVVAVVAVAVAVAGLR